MWLQAAWRYTACKVHCQLSKLQAARFANAVPEPRWAQRISRRNATNHKLKAEYMGVWKKLQAAALEPCLCFCLTFWQSIRNLSSSNPACKTSDHASLSNVESKNIWILLWIVKNLSCVAQTKGFSGYEIPVAKNFVTAQECPVCIHMAADQTNVYYCCLLLFVIAYYSSYAYHCLCLLVFIPDLGHSVLRGVGSEANLGHHIFWSSKSTGSFSLLCSSTMEIPGSWV